MVRRNLLRWIAAALALAAVRPAAADPIAFTGNVEKDFPVAPNNGVSVYVDSPLPDGSPDPNHVPQDAWMTSQGLTSGWSMKDIRLSYDKASDTLAVGVNFFGIAGDSDGNGDPGVASPQMKAEGGVDNAHLGGRKSITVGLDFHGTGTPDIVAGVPADKSKAGPGLDGFNVAAYQPSSLGMEYNYGKTLTDHLGALAFDPSKDHPGFEFTVKNFSTIPGNDLSKGFSLSAFAGSPDDVVAGEDAFASRHVLIKDAQTAPQAPLTPPPHLTTPEPATVLAWSAVLVGAGAIRLRRRRAGA